MDVKFYKCSHCGNVAVKPYDQGVPLVCCGEKMGELVAGATDGAHEKHVPVVSIEGSSVHVEVGSVIHPMTPEHHIGLICLVSEQGYQMRPDLADGAPIADFALAEGDAPLKVYEYCNLHGLWVAEV